MRRRRLLIILLLLVVLGLLGWAWRASRDSGKNYSQLTGLKVSAADAKRPILGIMIENSPPARPQTGLSSAGIVFETVTEGGITRYLALYQENQPDVVGPVRSLRPYFVHWALGFDASVAHVGGSPEALKLAGELHLKDLNQFKYGDAFFRDNSRPAPHNAYARAADLRKLQAQLGYGKSSFKSIPRKNDDPAKTVEAGRITVDFSGPGYQTEFRYQASSDSYARYLAGSQQTDKGGNKVITVKNVIVIRMPGGTVDALSSGDALVFNDGRVTKARWQQNGDDNRITVTDNSGKEVPLDRGSTWFEVITTSGNVSYQK